MDPISIGAAFSSGEMASGIIASIDNHPFLDLCGVARSVPDLLRLIERFHPSAILMSHLLLEELVLSDLGSTKARELGLPLNVPIVTGAHDQCANAVGCGVIEEGRAVYGIGTFICITPVFTSRRQPGVMIERGLNTEHHAVPGQYVSFIYNQGGGLVKWFRDTFAAADHRQAEANGRDIYTDLFSEMPEGASSIMVLPHFTTTGPPDFISDSCGVIAGLRLDTSRSDVLKGIVEGTTSGLRRETAARALSKVMKGGFAAQA